ncbi:MAG: hypothetical protein JNM56_37215 [Planctomycetia bacterium]|nr:hypothetical protein [Planctomycetia bacterium]
MMRRMSPASSGLLLALSLAGSLFVSSTAQAVNPAQHSSRLGCNGNGNGAANRPTPAQAQQMALYQAQMQQLQMQQLQAYQQLQQAAIYQAQMQQAAAAQRAQAQQLQQQKTQQQSATPNPFSAPARSSVRERPEGRLSVTASRIDGKPVEELTPEQKAQKAEELATGKLKLAKMLADEGRDDKAALRLQEIVDAYPDTKAATEAKELLAKVCK